MSIGGVPVRVLADQPAGADALRLLLGGLDDDDRDPLATLEVVSARAPAATRPPDSSYDDREIWRDGEELTVLDATGAVAVAGPWGARIATGGADPAMAALAVRRLFLAAAGHALAFFDRFVIHAGAVGVDGAGLLVLGSTGAGKSTLALAALESGWPVLSDDLVVVRRMSDGEIQVNGVPRPPAVPTDLRDELTPGARRMPDDPRGRAEIPAHHLHPGWSAVHGVIICDHGATIDGELRPVPWSEVMHLVIGSFPPADHPGHLKRIHPVVAAIARLPAARLCHGSDPASRLAVAARRLAEFSRSLPA